MKRTKHIVMFSLMAVAALVLASCQDGVFEGTGGGGNLVITGLSGYKGKYIEISGTAGGANIGFGASAGKNRILISGGSVSAPVYNQTTFVKYTGSDSCAATIKIYDGTTTITDIKTQPVSIKFYSGSAWL